MNNLIQWHWQLNRQLSAWLCLLACLFSSAVHATCSIYLGQAAVNEISKEHNWKLNTGDFIELKLLDSGISSSVYDDWTVTLCESTSSPACTTLAVSSFAQNNSYLTKAGSSTWGYVNWRGAFDVLVKDGSGFTIDYVSVNGHSGQTPACTNQFDSTATTGSSTRRIRRLPDGSGDWDVPPGNSEPATEGDTNTSVPAGSATLSIMDATTPQGSDMEFDISLPGNTANVVITYSTFDGTATGGTDYTVTTSSITVPSGTTTATITVPTLNSSATVSQNFYLLLDSVTNAFASDQVAIGTITVATATPVDHYRLEYDGSALTCASETVRLKACANADCSTPYASAVTVTFTASIPLPDSSSSTVTFTDYVDIDVAEVTETEVTLSLSATNPAAASPLQCYKNNVEDISCSYDVVDIGFIFLNQSDSNEVIPTQLSDKPSNTGYNSKNLSLQAVQLDTNTGSCAPLFVDGSDAMVELAYQCESPSNCSGSPVTITNNGNTLTLGKYTNYIESSVHFASESKATIVIQYPEAGQIKLHARKSIELVPGETKVVTGSSNSFVVRPFGLRLDLNGVANGIAVDEDGSAFRRTGETFTVNATGVRWVSGEDSIDNNGIPDNLTDVNDNGTAANFAGSGLTLSHLATQPVGAAQGTLSGTLTGQAFAASLATVNDIAWNEVGIINLNAQLSSAYLTTTLVDDNIYGALANVGRFVPDHFTLISSSLTNGCGPFTYMAQDFNVILDIQAQNSTNDITTNYVGGHDNATLAFVAEDVVVGTDVDLSTRLIVAPTVWAAGEIDGAFAASITQAVDGPFDNTFIGLRLDDGEPDMAIGLSNDLNMNAATDGTCVVPNCDALRLNTTGVAFRSGRLNSAHAYGPATQQMQMPLFLEFFDGNAYVISTTDNCSMLAANEVTITGSATVAFGSYDVTAIGGGPGIASTSVVDLTNGAEISSVNGYFDLTFEVPEANGGGTITMGEATLLLNTDPYPWLQFDWDGDGDIDVNDGLPVTIGTFGQSRGNDRVIYWREIK